MYLLNILRAEYMSLAGRLKIIVFGDGRDMNFKTTDILKRYPDKYAVCKLTKVFLKSGLANKLLFLFPALSSITRPRTLYPLFCVNRPIDERKPKNG
jgi:hypothetical protein